MIVNIIGTLKGKYMLNKLGSSLILLLISNMTLAVNDGPPAGASTIGGSTATPVIAKSTVSEDKLSVLNVKKQVTEQSIAEKTLADQIALKKLEVQLKEQEVKLKEAEKKLKDIDNPNKDMGSPYAQSALPPGLTIPALTLPKMSTPQTLLGGEDKPKNTAVTKKKKKGKEDKDKIEEKPVIKDLPFEALPLVKGYGGFLEEMQATIIHSNGSETQVSIGDTILPNVTVTAITDKGVFVKNGQSTAKLAMWTKMANQKAKDAEKAKEQEAAQANAQPLMQSPANGPIIYPGLSPTVTGELIPLRPGNGEIIIPKTVGNLK